MLEQVKTLHAEIAHFQAKDEAALEEFRRKFIAKKGAITTLFTDLQKVGPGEKKEFGIALNGLKNAAQEKFKVLIEQLGTVRQVPERSEEDLTLPPPAGTLGTLHPLTIIGNNIIALFEKIGFNISEGPEIEDDWHNFTALNFSRQPSSPGHAGYFFCCYQHGFENTHFLRAGTDYGKPAIAYTNHFARQSF